MTLTYMQRKALRRISRGQTISRSIAADPLIRKCYSTGHYVFPTPDMNIVEWCDAEAQMFGNRPRITEFGQKLLQGLNE